MGEKNIIIIKNGNNERLLNQNETIDGLDIWIEGNNNTIKIELPLNAHNSFIGITNNNVSINIESLPDFSNMNIYCSNGDSQILKIGKGTSMMGGKIHLEDSCGIIIGKDCMFSTGVNIWPTDGHTILDNKTKEVLNKPNKNIIIGNHCWIGEDVRITKNFSIGNNCIVGGGCVAVKEYNEDNIIIAGNPGKIVKQGITWSRLNPYHYEKQKHIKQ